MRPSPRFRSFRHYKVLGRDDRAIDELIGVFVFVAVFVAVAAALIGLMAPVISSNRDAGSFTVYQGSEIIGGREYLFVDPDAGYDLTEADATDYWKHDADESVFFEEEALTPDTIEAQLILDNTDMPLVDVGAQTEHQYEDYLMFYTEYGWWSNDEVAIPLAALISHQVKDTNQSVVSFMLHNQNYSLITTTPGGPEYFSFFILLTDFNIRIAVPSDLTDTVAKSTSMWTVLGQLLTARLPDVNPFVNLLIAVPFWTACGWLGVMIVRAFIPFLG